MQHNVADDNHDIERTVELLLAEDPDIVALEELTSENLPEYEAALPEGDVLLVVQLDHVLARGAEVMDVRVLPRSRSDHLPVVAHVWLK